MFQRVEDDRDIKTAIVHAAASRPGSDRGRMSLPRVIVVDDEEGVRETIADYLGEHGFDVRAAEGGLRLDRLLAERPADLVLLDLNMPGENGLSIARRLRARGDIPIVMVTAADTLLDRVVGLELGADDYVSKPFDLRELRSRLKAVLRRAALSPRADAEATPEDDAARAAALTPFGRAMLDLEAHAMVVPDGSRSRLSPAEIRLVRAFLDHPMRVLSRKRIAELAGEADGDASGRSIDIRITRLRRKVEEEPSRPQTIRTVRGAGYLFVPGRRPA